MNTQFETEYLWHYMLKRDRNKYIQLLYHKINVSIIIDKY